MKKHYLSSKNVMFVVMGIGFLGSIALGILLSQHLIQRIRKTDELAEKLGEGDLTQTISDDGTDELGHMATSLNKSVENMRTLVAELATWNTRNILYNRRIISHDGRDFSKYGDGKRNDQSNQYRN